MACLDSHKHPNNSPLLALLYSEFDNVVGPTIVYQTPHGFVPPEQWAAVCDFFITERDFCRKLTILASSDYKFYGFPMVLEHEKYHRHAFFFNISFAVHKDCDGAPYEPVLAKLASILETLELESEFLFNPATRQSLGPLLDKVFLELSTKGECTDLVANEANRINLKLLVAHKGPPPPLDHEVPVLMIDLDRIAKGGWDISILEVLPLIDGVNCVKRIADQGGMDIPIVRKAIWILMYYGCVALVDIFQYTNVYVPTRKLHELYKNKDLQRQAISFIQLTQDLPSPSFTLIFSLYASMERGLRMKEFCVKHRLLERNINPHSFVVFGCVNKLITRVQKYPILRPRHIDSKQELEAPVIPSMSSVPAVVDRAARGGVSYMNGTHSYDELCLLFNKSYNEVDSDIRASPDCVIISR